MNSFHIHKLLGLSEPPPPPSTADPQQEQSELQERAEPEQKCLEEPRKPSKRARKDVDSVGNSSDDSQSESEVDRSGGAAKPKRLRTAFTSNQLRTLEHSFRVCPYPDSYGREHIARITGIGEAKIQVWFQNRRARYRKREKPLESHPGFPISSLLLQPPHTVSSPAATRPIFPLLPPYSFPTLPPSAYGTPFPFPPHTLTSTPSPMPQWQHIRFTSGGKRTPTPTVCDEEENSSTD